jgi:hypothetical protein
VNLLVIEVASLFFTGLLAGIEFIVCFGLRTPLTVLDVQPQIQVRQALIRRLRVLVPAVFFLTAMSMGTVLVVCGTSPGILFRCIGLLAMVIWTFATFMGTVPINQAVLSWRRDAPPENWMAIVKKWERLDLVRTWAALAAFASLLAAVALRAAAVAESP